MIGGLAALLAVAVGLQVRPGADRIVVRRSLPLAEYFPRVVAGWRGRDLPLGATEAELGAVHKILNFDDSIFRSYRRDEREFSLYVAYWTPGKMPAREIDFHVPDVCWTMVGWKVHKADFHYVREFEGHRLAPAQYREFDDPNGRQYVLYWHILDGRPITYSTTTRHNQVQTLESVLRMGLNQRGEQYFIRISSATPLDELWREDGFQAVMERIAPLGPGLHPDA